MFLGNNQFKIIEEKLRYYNKPFIKIDFLQQILKKFAPNYKIKSLSNRGLISPIVRGKLYLNHLSSKKAGLVATTILAKYGEGKCYAVGGLYIYNRYNFSEQIANQITVYNTNIHGPRTIAGFQFILKKVRASFFWGIEQLDAQGYGKYSRMTPERALIQFIKDTKGNLEYADDIYHEIQKSKNSKKILLLSKKYTSKNTQILVEEFLKKGQI